MRWALSTLTGSLLGRDQGRVGLSPAGHTQRSGKLQRPEPLTGEWGIAPRTRIIRQVSRHAWAQFPAASTSPLLWLKSAPPHENKSSNSMCNTWGTPQGTLHYEVGGKGGCIPLQHPRRKARQSCHEQGRLWSSPQCSHHPEHGCFLRGAP